MPLKLKPCLNAPIKVIKKIQPCSQQKSSHGSVSRSVRLHAIKITLQMLSDIWSWLVTRQRISACSLTSTLKMRNSFPVKICFTRRLIHKRRRSISRSSCLKTMSTRCRSAWSIWQTLMSESARRKRLLSFSMNFLEHLTAGVSWLAIWARP